MGNANSLLTLATGIFALVALANDAIADYVWNDYGGHSYALTQTVGTWEQCEQEANTLGGHLVTINNPTENQWLANTFHEDIERQGYVWIGLYQLPGSPEPDQGWVWISSEPVTFLGWGGDEPNNDGGYENYGALTTNVAPPQWNDWGYVLNYHAIQGIVEVPEPSTLVLLDMGAFGLLAYAWRRWKLAA